MPNSQFSFRNVPGWIYTLVILGLLYLSGLHTEAIGQVQRIILATGIMQPDLAEIAESESAVASGTTSELTAGNDFLLQDLNGNTIKFSSLQNKVIFLNIWATWCPPCVAEMPGIQNLYDKLKPNKNIAFVMLSVDEAGLAKVKKFIAKKGYTFPVYLPASNLPQAFETQSIPTTFILDRNGKIVARHEGMADYNSEKVKEYLVNLAK